MMKLRFNIGYLGAVLLAVSSYSSFAQDIHYARSIVKTLASPAFKGRGYVEDGDKTAAAFIAGEYKKSGLIPINKGSYFQEYNLSVNTFPGQVSVKLNGSMLLKTAADYLIDASSPSVHGTFDIIQATREQFKTDQKFLDLLAEAKDAFILLDDQSDTRETKEETNAVAEHIAALQNSDQAVIKGFIIYSDRKLTWTTLPYQTAVPVVTINKRGLDINSIHTITIDVDSKFILQYTTKNIAGMIKGTSTSDSTIVISAHYDHLGMLGKKIYFPGANDNASGTAMLLSLARYYSVHRPKYRMVFLAFSGEEIGLLGSKAFVEHPLIDLGKIKFLINFDLAGTGSEGIKVVNGTIFKAQFDLLVNLNQQYKLLPKVEIRGEACISDHCRFYAKGVPSFLIYTQGGIQAYHDIYDRAETLPLTEFEHYFKLMVRFCQAL